MVWTGKIRWRKVGRGRDPAASSPSTIMGRSMEAGDSWAWAAACDGLPKKKCQKKDGCQYKKKTCEPKPAGTCDGLSKKKCKKNIVRKLMVVGS